MLTLRGAAALSAPQRARRLALLQGVDADVDAVAARYIHLVDVERPLGADEQQLLERLLDYGADALPAPAGAELFVVVPRLGTVSPWSTKATDIARRCGLDAVRRLERGVAWYVGRCGAGLDAVGRAGLAALLHDRMTESVLGGFDALAAVFETAAPRPLACVDILGGGIAALETANASMGLALSAEEVSYLYERFVAAGHNPTDVELMMFAQVNSEHCRHKIFNAEWVIDGEPQARSLLDMIRETHRRHGQGTLVAYRDNAAVLAGSASSRFFADPASRRYVYRAESLPFVVKVETHNHPTAISPFAGAATGSGGEIRDEGATGRGAKPKAGITGFAVSHLRLPGAEQPWEGCEARPPRIVSPLQIMLEGPVGGAAFNNEFGRPNIGGFFRTFEHRAQAGDPEQWYGYHKPIMLAGGLGNIRPEHVAKAPIPAGAHVVVLGGPAMLIGLGGGAASSVATGASSEELDFASVQRANPEMQRRCQEVIDRCCALGEHNPILSIHDVGAGGLCNALPELLHDSARGGRLELRRVLSDDSGMTPLELWCNEAQERYVLAVAPERRAEFEAICERERCLYAVVGVATAEPRLSVADSHFGGAAAGGDARRAVPIDIDMETLFGKPPRMRRDVARRARAQPPLSTRGLDVAEAVERVLRLPAVADKTFLVTIGDRSVTGLIHRDPMVGPWQVPAADVAVTLAGYDTHAGEAMALGERTPLAVLDAAASGRMAVAEALTNLAAADVARLGDVKLSANWMAAAGAPGEDAALYDTVRAVAEELCPRLGISIPVGKDSLSMRTLWRDAGGTERAVHAPLSLVVTAFAPVGDVRRTWTPVLAGDAGDTVLVLVDLGGGRNRLGASALAQVYARLGDAGPDLDDPARLVGFWAALTELRRAARVLAYHDRSDGGLLASVCEMAFAGRMGVEVDLEPLGPDPVAALFSEEPGVLMQIRRADREGVMALLARHGLGAMSHVVGVVVSGDRIEFRRGREVLFAGARSALHRLWSETTWRLQSLRDNPDCAQQEYDRILDTQDPGLHARLGFDPAEDVAAPFVARGARPAVAILREQGVNGHVEMAAAFHRAGFDAIDVTMSDILARRATLTAVVGLAACGGFSFGDVLGAGQGWAKSILFNDAAREEFTAFFARGDTFALGVCNGCQMLAALGELIPGSAHWPAFRRNLSEQFEARLVMVEVVDSASIFLSGMAGSRLPVVVAHGEGRACLRAAGDGEALARKGLVALRFVDHRGGVATTYPYNPNGSAAGITAVTTPDGRVTAMMPHPERVYRTATNSWHPPEWGEDGPWLRMFRNARTWVG